MLSVMAYLGTLDNGEVLWAVCERFEYPVDQGDLAMMYALNEHDEHGWDFASAQIREAA